MQDMFNGTCEGPVIEQARALKIAGWLEAEPSIQVFQQAAVTELRRLHEVNAELLAAFKDLLEANSYYFPAGNPWGDRARTAINKATGETE
jgi:hypothetical protein